MPNCEKPFLTYKQLIEKIKSKGIIVDNEDFALQVLSNCSYYNIINRYQDYINNSQSITLEKIYTLYTLDTALSSIVLKYILHIERSLKSKLSYVISDNYGEWTESTDGTHTTLRGYLDRNNYSNSHNNRNSTIKSIYKTILDAKSTTNCNYKYISSSLNHYAEHHNHIPPWVLTTSLSFGVTKQWYSILVSEDKNAITNAFIKTPSLNDEQKKEYLMTSLDLLREFRNAVAHGGKTSDIQTRIIPKRQLILLSDGLITDEDYNTIPSVQSGIIATICVLSSLLNDVFLQNALKLDILNLFAFYRQGREDFSSMGIWNGLGLTDKFLNNLLHDIFK